MEASFEKKQSKSEWGKAILICGGIGFGKTFYAKTLLQTRRAVLLSADEVMLTLFGQDPGEKYDDYARRTQAYLYQKSLELLACGIDVVLDWGFWTKKSRAEARDFFRKAGAACELHYLDVSEALQRARIEERNRAVTSGKEAAYYVDEGLAKKCRTAFEKPAAEEIDITIREP